MLEQLSNIEREICHMKTNGLLATCLLIGLQGGAISAILALCLQNFWWIVNYLRARFVKRLAASITIQNDQSRGQITAPGIQKRNFTLIDDIMSGRLLVSAVGNDDNYGTDVGDELSIFYSIRITGATPNMQPPNRANRKSGLLLTSKIKELGLTPTIKVEDYLAEVLINCCGRLNAQI